MLRRLPEKAMFCIGLYPFLALNLQSKKQAVIVKISIMMNTNFQYSALTLLLFVALAPHCSINQYMGFRSRVLSTMVTLFVASLSLLPRRVLRLISELSNGKSWSNTAHEACCSHLPQYHTIRNVLYMARTEFIKLSETPDWEFMRENQEKISFLYGIDDHWGPLQMFEEVSRQASGIALSIEREGHTHGFCCTEAGSIWVARH
ncbi:hypothetical protein Gotri_011523, partial [Gossypium trilobum]|nr:hypothetical protein [Gossypium trilobum]